MLEKLNFKDDESFQRSQWNICSMNLTTVDKIGGYWGKKLQAFSQIVAKFF